ncbi:hypothetical protein ASZ78_002645, partial [Callipepla squamata]
RQQRLPGGNKSQQHTDHQQGGTKHNRDHQKLYQGGQAPHSSGRPGHHGYSQNRRWHHNQKHSPNDKETHRNTKETENLKIEDTSTCTGHSPAETQRSPEAVEKQSQPYSPEVETKRKDSVHERVGERPKINLLQSSKDRLRRRLKEKTPCLSLFTDQDEVTVETTHPEKNKMDKLIEILNSMRNNSSDVDSKLTTFMEEAQNSTNSEEMLGEIVKTIYQKAVTDRSFASTAAKLCDKMALFMVEGTKFRSLLLNMLQGMDTITHATWVALEEDMLVNITWVQLEEDMLVNITWVIVEEDMLVNITWVTVEEDMLVNITWVPLEEDVLANITWVPLEEDMLANITWVPLEDVLTNIL